MEEFIFEKLDVWKKSKNLVAEIYRILAKFPNLEKYAICDQIRRASVSIPSNIAEGSGRASIKEKIHFIEIAYGSLMETFCQLDISVELGYITPETLSAIRPAMIEVSKMLSGWRNNLKTKLKETN